MKYLLPLLPLSLALAATAALAGPSNDTEQLRCLAIADPAARLACYDAAATALRDGRSAPAIPAASVAPAAQTGNAAGPAIAAAPAATAEQSFGLPAKRSSPADATLQSAIKGRFDGWTKGQFVDLVNGQTWQFVEDGTVFRALSEPKVTIKPGMFGSFFIEIEGISITARVKRIN